MRSPFPEGLSAHFLRKACPQGYPPRESRSPALRSAVPPAPWEPCGLQKCLYLTCNSAASHCPSCPFPPQVPCRACPPGRMPWRSPSLRSHPASVRGYAPALVRRHALPNRAQSLRSKDTARRWSRTVPSGRFPRCLRCPGSHRRKPQKIHCPAPSPRLRSDRSDRSPGAVSLRAPPEACRSPG